MKRSLRTVRMLNLPVLLKKAEKVVADNSPLIMTALGVTGALATAVLAGKASFKAAQLLADEDPHMETKEKVFLVWKLYVPAAGTAALTVAAILLSHHVSARRAAMIASAYAMSEKAFEEYKEKVIEKMGAKKEEAVRHEINQDRLDRNPVTKSEVIIISGNVLCYDKISGRYFTSDYETIRRAQNDINEQIIHSHYASLGDFYDIIGLPQIGLSEEIGWNLDTMLEIKYDHGFSDDHRPCLVIEFEVSPSRSFFRMG